MKQTYLDSLMNPTFLRSDGAKLPNDTGWQDRHVLALRARHGMGAAIVGMLHAWASYADRHADRYESGIGADGVLGPAWADMGRAILDLLNGDCGNLDCGTLDGFIRRTLAAEGFGDE